MYLNKILVRNWHKIISPNKLFLLSHAEKVLPCLPFISVMRMKTSAFGA